MRCRLTNTLFNTSDATNQLDTHTSHAIIILLVSLCSPNEDFGRSSEHLDEFLRSTYQGCEYRIWATKRWNVLRKDSSSVSFGIPKYSFGSHKVVTRRNRLSCVLDRRIVMLSSSCDSQLWVGQTHRHAHAIIISRSCEFDRRIVMLSSSCELYRHIVMRYRLTNTLFNTARTHAL